MHKINIVILACAALVGCASAPVATARKNPAAAKEPAWVMSPREAFPEAQYVAASASGSSKEAAERSALGALVAIFGQSVKGDTTVSYRYSEALKSGAIVMSEDQAIDSAVQTSYDLDTVVGAEIKETWFDGKSTTWAVAVMDKGKGTILYADLIEKNEAAIAKLVDIPADEKNTLDAYARLDLAATIAETNGRFLNVLSVLSPAAAAAKRGSMRSAEDLKVECVKLAQTIPVSVSVAGDSEGRIQAAFSGVLSQSGFKTGGKNSRYELAVKISMSPVTLGDNPNKFVRYVVDASLTDTKTGNVLLPYSTSGREGHTTVPEAENRAIRAAEKKIKDDYLAKFGDFLAQLSAK